MKAHGRPNSPVAILLAPPHEPAASCPPNPARRQLRAHAGREALERAQLHDSTPEPISSSAHVRHGRLKARALFVRDDTLFKGLSLAKIHLSVPSAY